MSKLRLMKAGHGDLCLAEWETLKNEGIEEARRLFREHRDKGCLAFRLDAPGQQTPIESFDEAAPEILLVPAIRGG